MSKAAERIAREMLLAGTSGRPGWMSEQEAARRRRRMAGVARDVATAVAAMALLGALMLSASCGLDREAAAWEVGDYANAPTWQDEEGTR